MKILIAVLMLFMAGCASMPESDYSKRVYRATDPAGGEVILRLHERACDDESTVTYVESLGELPEGTTLRAASLFYDGRDWKACYLEFQGTIYAAVGEDRSRLRPTPAAMFRDESV